MNKKEVIEEIEKEKSNFNAWEHSVRNRALDDALAIVRKLDEPEKPKVPQFVADWYEANKEDFEIYLSELCINFTCHRERLNEKLANWYEQLENKPMQTLVNMHQFGYEIEKEKLYRVELPNPNGDSNRYGLCKVDGRVIIGSFVFGLDKAVNTKLTESEIKQDFEWAWQFAEEVSNND